MSLITIKGARHQMTTCKKRTMKKRKQMSDNYLQVAKY